MLRPETHKRSINPDFGFVTHFIDDFHEFFRVGQNGVVLNKNVVSVQQAKLKLTPFVALSLSCTPETVPESMPITVKVTVEIRVESIPSFKN